MVRILVSRRQPSETYTPKTKKKKNQKEREKAAEVDNEKVMEADVMDLNPTAEGAFHERLANPVDTDRVCVRRSCRR